MRCGNRECLGNKGSRHAPVMAKHRPRIIWIGRKVRICLVKNAGVNRRPRTDVKDTPEMRQGRFIGVIRHTDHFSINQISKTYRSSTFSHWEWNYHPYTYNHGLASEKKRRAEMLGDIDSHLGRD